MIKKTIIILIIAVIIAGIFLIVTNDYNLAKRSDSAEFLKSWTGWISRIATNSVNTVGYVIKLDWVPR